MLRKLFCCMIKENNYESPIPFGEDISFEYKDENFNENIIYNLENYNKDIHKEIECPICFEEFDNEIAILPCSHYFHEECLIKWWNKSNKFECPICRS